jgi:hypothetical protein
MRLVLASFVLSAMLPMLHAQGIGAVVGDLSDWSGHANPAAQTNNPFTLVLERKTVQTLPDGTHITRTEHETILRDTLGRTRTEQTTEGLPGQQFLHVISVDDIVAGRRYNWLQADGAIKEYSVREIRSFPATSRMRSVPASQADTTVEQTTHQYHIVRAAKAPPNMPQAHQENLGMKDIQGAPCKAIRITTVYPEGFFGNDRPITEIEERCYSLEFQRDLEGTRVDPRSGTTTTTMITLSRGEPDASLFHPPPDYKERPIATNGVR